jgi:hypothetical protein
MTSGEGVDVVIVLSKDGLAMTIVGVMVTKETIAQFTVSISDAVELVSLQSAIALLNPRCDDILLYPVFTVHHEGMVTHFYVGIVRHVEGWVDTNTLIASEHLGIVATLAAAYDEVGLLLLAQLL